MANSPLLPSMHRSSSSVAVRRVGGAVCRGSTSALMWRSRRRAAHPLLRSTTTIWEWWKIMLPRTRQPPSKPSATLLRLTCAATASGRQPRLVTTTILSAPMGATRFVEWRLAGHVPRPTRRAQALAASIHANPFAAMAGAFFGTRRSSATTTTQLQVMGAARAAR